VITSIRHRGASLEYIIVISFLAFIQAHCMSSLGTVSAGGIKLWYEEGKCDFKKFTVQTQDSHRTRSRHTNTQLY
jgi:hypothetical protein